jgi:hypothetical protein
MRTVIRSILLSLVVAPVAYWLLGGGLSLPSLSDSTTGNSSLCERVDWHFAPVAAGRREWVASMEGAQDDPQVADWLRMDDAGRGAVLAQCGKER